MGIKPCSKDEFKTVVIKLTGVLENPGSGSTIFPLTFQPSSDCTGLPFFSYSDPYKLIDYNLAGWVFYFGYESVPYQTCTYVPGNILYAGYKICGSSKYKKSNLNTSWSSTNEISIISNSQFSVPLLKNKNNRCMVSVTSPCGNCVSIYGNIYSNSAGRWIYVNRIISGYSVNHYNNLPFVMSISQNLFASSDNIFYPYNCNTSNGNCD